MKKRKVSFINVIDRFLYDEQMALMRREITDVDIRRAEAKIELALAERKFKQWKAAKKDYRDKYYHPSAIGGCARRTVYKSMRAPKNKPPMGGIADIAKSQRIFATGDSLHLRMQVLFVRMGLCTIDDIEVPFTVGDEQGTCDAIVSLKGKKYIVDFKSINDYGFKNLGRHYGKEGYKQQIHMYMKHLKIHRAVFIYENKNDQTLRETFFEFNKSDERKRKKRLDYLRDHVDNRKLPKREGESVHRFPCKGCFYTNICWDERKGRKWLKNAKGRKAKRKGPSSKKRSAAFAL